MPVAWSIYTKNIEKKLGSPAFLTSPSCVSELERHRSEWKSSMSRGDASSQEIDHLAWHLDEFAPLGPQQFQEHRNHVLRGGVEWQFL